MLRKCYRLYLIIWFIAHSCGDCLGDYNDTENNIGHLKMLKQTFFFTVFKLLLFLGSYLLVYNRVSLPLLSEIGDFPTGLFGIRLVSACFTRKVCYELLH